VIKLVEVKNNGTCLNKFVVVAEDKPSIVVGIPAYNKEKTIAKVVLESQRFADKVVVCDDGSSDMTAEIAERLGADLHSHNPLHNSETDAENKKISEVQGEHAGD